MFLGWWGIPWGPIRSIQALITNAKGGIDVTEAVLVQNLGPEGARRAMAFRPTNKQGTDAGLWALRLAILTPAILFALMVLAIARGIGDTDKKQNAMPGHAEFAKAESALRSGQGGASPAAKELAGQIQQQFSTDLADSNTRLFTDSSSTIFHCHKIDNRLVIFVRFTEWRKWGEATQKLVADTLWSATQSAVAASSLGKEENLRLHLGIKGLVNWVHLAEGGITGQPTGVNPNPNNEDLIPLFAESPVAMP